MSRPGPRMSDAQHQAVSAEPVRVTLGSRIQRPELEATLDLHDLHVWAERAAAAARRAMVPVPTDRQRSLKPKNRSARGRRR